MFDHLFTEFEQVTLHMAVRYTRAKELEAAKEEMFQASKETNSHCRLLDDDLKVVANTYAESWERKQ